MADIFISYAREDETRIRDIVPALEEQGWSVFWDRRIPIGSTWQSYLGQALSDAKCVIVAWSHHSITSKWVIEEANDAEGRGLLMPILLDSVNPPLGFRGIQAADLTDWRPGYSSPHFDQLIRDIVGIVGTKPDRPAPEQDRLKGDSDRLEEIVSGDAEVHKIKTLINDHRTILNGVPHCSSDRNQLVEDVMDLSVSENLTVDFTRFVFYRPANVQVPNSIIFIDFLSPKDSVFLDGTTKSPEVEKNEKTIMSYMNFVSDNYDSYCKRVVMLDTFTIPLSTLQDRDGTRLAGVLVVGRRKYLTAEQIRYLRTNNISGTISIITYDFLIKYLRPEVS